MIIIDAILHAIWPKKETNESDRLFQWRQTVSASIIAGGCVMIFYGSWAAGYLAYLGISGFVTEVQFKQAQEILVSIRVNQIENRIVMERKDQCVALMEGNSAAMNKSYFAVQEQLQMYFAATKREYRLPECAELLPSTPSAPEAGPIPRGR